MQISTFVFCCWCLKANISVDQHRKNKNQKMQTLTVSWIHIPHYVWNDYMIYLADIDDCNSAPCQNNGTCVDRINDFSCICALGYTDKECSTGKLSAFKLVMFLFLKHKALDCFLIVQAVSAIFCNICPCELQTTKQKL